MEPECPEVGKSSSRVRNVHKACHGDSTRSEGSLLRRRQGRPLAPGVVGPG